MTNASQVQTRRRLTAAVLLESLEQRAMFSSTTAAPLMQFSPPLLAEDRAAIVAMAGRASGPVAYRNTTPDSNPAKPGGQPQPGDIPDVITGRKINVFAWSPTLSAEQQNHMVWVYMDHEPVDAAHRAAAELATKEPGERVIILWDALKRTLADYYHKNPGEFLAQDLDYSADRQWVTTFFTALRGFGGQVDRVATDNETNFSTWSLFWDANSAQDQVAIMRSIYGNPGAYARLPESVRAFRPDDFANLMTIRGRAAFIAWNDWASEVLANAYKGSVVGPIHAIYGASVGVSNFGDITANTPILDKNGWPLFTAADELPGNVNSPECYIWAGGAYADREKDWRWNRVIDIINTVRAAQRSAGADGAAVTPWISYPGFRGDDVQDARSTWLWEQMVRHLAAGGIESFYYWNPSVWTNPADEQFAGALFNSLTVGDASAANEQIAYDADEIVTNGWRTTYADFLRFVDLIGATDMGKPTPAPAPAPAPAPPPQPAPAPAPEPEPVPSPTPGGSTAGGSVIIVGESREATALSPEGSGTSSESSGSTRTPPGSAPAAPAVSRSQPAVLVSRPSGMYLWTPGTNQFRPVQPQSDDLGSGFDAGMRTLDLLAG